MQRIGSGELLNKKEYEVIELTLYLLLRGLLLVALGIALETATFASSVQFQVMRLLIWTHILYGIVNSGFIYSRNSLTPSKSQVWLDFTAIALLDQFGRHSLFDPWLCFLFLILLGAFFYSNRQAILLTVAIVALHIFMVFPQPDTPLAQAVPLGKALVEIAFTVMCGGILVYWGRNRLVNVRRLSFLYRIVDDINIRLGPEHTLKTLAYRLGHFLDAESVVIVSVNKSQHVGKLLRVNLQQDTQTMHEQELKGEALDGFATIQPGTLGLFNDLDTLSWFRRLTLRPWAWLDEHGQSQKTGQEEAGQTIAQLFDVPSLLTVELFNDDESYQRVFIGAKAGKHYVTSDLIFLRRVFLILRPFYNNVQLIFELMDDANRRERARIYHDLHDRSIQPYIGLRMSLQALLRSLDPSNPACAGVEEVLQYTNQSLKELRHFAVAFLNRQDINVRGLELLIHELLKRYERHFGIHTQLRLALPPEMPEMLLQEILAIVSEGLSNVMRHSDAKQVDLAIVKEAAQLRLEIFQHKAPDGSDPPKVVDPRSIAMRVDNLGGTLTVVAEPQGMRLTCLVPL